MQVALPRFIPGDELRISASAYVAWKKCPESANVKLQGIYGPDTRPAFVGSLAHRIFARHLASGPIDHDHFARACKAEIGGSNLNHKLGPLEMKPRRLDGVIEEVHALYQRFVNFPGEGFESSEETIDYEADGGVQFVGTIDAVFREDLGGHRLVDWKTGEIGEAEDQLMFYAFLWALDRDELPAYIEAVSVKTGERYHTVPSTGDVQRVADDVGHLVNGIRRSWNDGLSLERHGGPWCRYCPILADCAEGSATTSLLE
ncbi:MAG TPA: PD-(D/E)XK nuclease family protein [Acidimicrobiia bacterium]|nr:PD-(D/E)XK nuclease family protein [Acidimicrobiia bacterium]